MVEEVASEGHGDREPVSLVLACVGMRYVSDLASFPDFFFVTEISALFSAALISALLLALFLLAALISALFVVFSMSFLIWPVKEGGVDIGGNVGIYKFRNRGIAFA